MGVDQIGMNFKFYQPINQRYVTGKVILPAGRSVYQQVQFYRRVEFYIVKFTRMYLSANQR